LVFLLHYGIWSTVQGRILNCPSCKKHKYTPIAGDARCDSMNPSMSHPQNFRKHREEVAISQVQTTVVTALQQMCSSCSRNLGFKEPE
jgi:hypothetical protein